MKGIVKQLKAFWMDEEGQSTTEYILILAAVVLMAKRFSSELGNIVKNLTGTLNTNIQSTMDELQ